MIKKICSIVLLLLVTSVHSDELLFKFKSPSFSGVNASSHYLTIENQESTRKTTLKQDIEADLEDIEREKNNSTLARFMRNFESRVYAQLSRQMVEQLFGENPSTEGKLELEGNLIEYVVTGETITLTITDENNETTTITIPVGDFTF
tara:strand:- start:2175 stop:2618 length:444 start_codon:yes stop_codon:yes gene_type:complete